MNLPRTAVSTLCTAAVLVVALATLRVAGPVPEALGAPVPEDRVDQRGNGLSTCSVVMTDTVATSACAPTQVTVTLAVSCPIRLPLNVVMVIGRHLGMEDHLNEVKAAARDVVDRLNFDDGTKVGIVSLSTQDRVEQDLTDRKTTALAAINRIQLDAITPFNNYYDWIGQAERMLNKAQSDDDPAIPVIVLYSTGCPTGFDQYCQRMVGSANRAQGAGITMMTVCNPNARPFGFPIPGNHCRWIQQMASTRFYHDLNQAARISDDIEGLWDEGKSTTIDELVLTELLTSPLALIAGSAAPPPEPIAGGAVFRWTDLMPGSVVTATYAVSASPGTDVILRRDGSGAVLTDSRASSSELVSLPPRPLIVPECVAPTETPTSTPVPPTQAPSQTPTPTVTAEPRPGTVYLPILLRNHCQATRRYADVVLALDTSSSMAEPSLDTTKIEAAKSAARAFVAATRPDADQIAIVAFHETAAVAAPLGSSQADLVAAIDRLATHPGTRIDRALETSAGVLSGPGRRPRNRPVLILLSDGHSDGDRQAVVDAAHGLHTQGVTVYTVGLGPDVDSPLMEEVASSPPLYRAAQDAGALLRIYSEIVRELPCAVALAGVDGAGERISNQPPPFDQPAAYDGAAGGTVSVLAALGDEVYAGVGSRLVRYTELEPPQLTQAATTLVLDAMIRDIAVRPGRVLLATEGGIQSVVDHGPVLEPGTRISTFGQAVAVEEAFGHAYVAIGPPASGGVSVFDVSGLRPLPSGFVMDAWSVSDLAVSGRLLFASTGSGLVLASLARPDRPAEIGSFDNMPGAGPMAADPETGRVYVGGSDGVWVVDPTVPAVRGFVAFSTPTELAVDGDLLMAATASAEVVVVDVSDPDAPAVMRTIGLDEPAHALASADDAAYAGNSFGVRALDVIAGTSMVAATSFAPSDVAAGRAVPDRGDALYAAANSGLVVLEAPLSLGAPPMPVAVVAGPPATRVDTDGNWIALLSSDRVRLLDARTDPLRPVTAGEAPVESGLDVSMVGGSVVVAEPDGLGVFANSSPGTLARVGGVRGSWDLVRIEAAADGRHVFAMDRDFGIRVFSVASPETPRVVGSLEVALGEWGSALTVDGNRLHVNTRSNGSTRLTGRGFGIEPPAPPALERMTTIDVTNTEQPVVADYGPPFGWPSTAASGDGWLVVASSLGAGMPYPRRLTMFGPTEESLPLPWHAAGAARIHPHVFLAAGDAGLLAAHVPHENGLLPTATPWATATSAATPTVQATAPPPWRILLPAAETGI